MSKKSIIVLIIFMIFCLLFIGCKNENTGKDENDENIEMKKTIKFNSNGGSETKDIKVEKNSLIDEPEDPMREGYGFMGWYYKGENWNFSEDKVTKSIELTAKWVNLENYKIDGNKISSFARYDIIEIPNSYTKNGELIDITEINGFFGNNVIIYKIDINNKYYKVIDNNLYTEDGKTLVAISSVYHEIKIPSEVNMIKGEIFYTLYYDDTFTNNLNLDNNKNFLDKDGVIYTSDGTKLISVYDKNIRSITIPESVTSIGDYAFYGCSSLTSINVSNGNKYYKSIDGNLYTKDGTKLVQYAMGKQEETFVIPESITSIGNSAFYNCGSLTSIIISESVTNIGDRAFFNCYSLTSITIPESVTSIGDMAFSYCSSLTSITIPKSVINIENSSFSDCSSLTNINVSQDNKYYKSIDGNLYTVDGKILIRYAIGKQEETFVIPDSVTSIGDSVFGGCRTLTSITIPEGVTSIGDYAFSDCSSLTSITIPEGVTSIGDMAFKGCYSLTSITIPDSVTSIGEGAFSGCGRLASINVSQDNKYYKSMDGNLYTVDGKILIRYAIGKQEETFVILDSVSSIGDYAFGGCSSLTSITIPESVTSIGDYAFYGCSSLTSITIPESVTSIGESAFSRCSSLTSIIIPEGVTSIGDSAFSMCYNLTIYCEVQEQPEGWSYCWNDLYRPVIWGYKDNN